MYHFSARFYSPRLGRFLSADTIVPNPFNPQDLNRFSYVRNNPVRYTDPTGHRACDDFDAAGGCYTAPGGGGMGFGGIRPKPTEPDNSGGGVADNYCPAHIGACGIPIPDSNLDQNPVVADHVPLVVDPKTDIETSNGTAPTSFTQTSPDYEKIAEGTVLLVSLFLFVDIPIGIGLIELFPEMEIGMILTEAWIYPLAVALVDVHIYAVNLVYEGFTGEEKLVNPIISFP